MVTFSDSRPVLDADNLGREMKQLMCELYPICRSITGDGVRQTLRLIQEYIPLAIHEIPSGTPVFDWAIPKEWNIKDAYVKDPRGERIIDFQKSNVHVVGYSIPVHETVSLSELRQHLPDHPSWVPYRTSYYNEDWGFCLSYNQFLNLRDEDYEVRIDASLEAGHSTYGEYYLPGERLDEILISTHICHPSLCNDNLSGIAVLSVLAKYLAAYKHRYSYRFLFILGTIGSIAWLCFNECHLPRIKHGFVLAGVGDSGELTYKKSRRGHASIDKAAAHVLKHSGERHSIINFYPYGYDERQFCSPGLNLPIGCVMRTPYGQYPEYHTSADDLDFVQPAYLVDSFSKCASILEILESNATYVNQYPKCEPHLGKRRLYRTVRGNRDDGIQELALLWVLNLSDGKNTVLDIADQSGLEFGIVHAAADALAKHGLLRVTDDTAE